jgi:hypothetical protein
MKAGGSGAVCDIRADVVRARSLRPLMKARPFGMTPQVPGNPQIQIAHYGYGNKLV